MTIPTDKNAGLTVEQLRTVVRYDAPTGLFTWRKKINQAGGVAGWTNPKTGYVLIKVCGRNYMAHRLAWFYVHGTWPRNRLDHINCAAADNRLANLREADDQQSSANRRGKHGRVLPKGVEEFLPGRFRARLRLDGRVRDLGYFDTPDDASAAYAAAAKANFGEFARSE